MEVKKLSPESEALVNSTLIDEYTAAYTYDAMGNFLQGIGFEKAAAFFKAESKQEYEHAAGLEKYIVDWNGIPKLPPIQTPKLTFNGLADCIDVAYQLEYGLFGKYSTNAATALKSGDIQTFQFLSGYVQIQNDSVIEYSDMKNLLEGTNTSSKFEMLLLEDKLFG